MTEDKINMTHNSKLVSINIIRGSELTEATRVRNDISNQDFVELRVERNSPATPKIIKMTKSPAMTLRDSMKNAGLNSSSFD